MRMLLLDTAGPVAGIAAFTGDTVLYCASARVPSGTEAWIEQHGLAFARGVEVAPVSSLALRACLAPGQPRVLSLLDARKGKVYGGWFDTRGPLPLPLGPELDILLDEVSAQAPGIAVGEGAAVFADAVRAAGHTLHATPADSPVGAGATLCRSLEGRSAGTVGLRYLREPDARPSRV
jgi:tRNA A37 threonylcarbamoyladenosine modification protein TsaB